MGIWGFIPIEDKKALEIIRENIDIITQETWNAMITVNASRGGGASGLDGDQLMWNMITTAEEKIPAYIIKESLNIPIDYPYGDPSIFVSCSIYTKYVNATKEDKRLMSSALSTIKKSGIQGLVDNITKVYCDNIEKSLIKPKPYDKQKEVAIKVLADGFKDYKLVFPQNKKDSQNKDGVPRTKKK